MFIEKRELTIDGNQYRYEIEDGRIIHVYNYAREHEGTAAKSIDGEYWYFKDTMGFEYPGSHVNEYQTYDDVVRHLLASIN